MSLHKAADYATQVIALIRKLDPGLNPFPYSPPCTSTSTGCTTYILTNWCLTPNGEAATMLSCATKLAGTLGDSRWQPVRTRQHGRRDRRRPGQRRDRRPGQRRDRRPGQRRDRRPGRRDRRPGQRRDRRPGQRRDRRPGQRRDRRPGQRRDRRPGQRRDRRPGQRRDRRPGSGGTGGQGSGGPTSERQPLGELLSVDMELAGLQGQPMLLSWSIFQEGGQSHLSRNWLGNFAAYRLEATTNDDSGTLEMWIPIPSNPGHTSFA